jgi:ribose 5-phosphate isomerase B
MHVYVASDHAGFSLKEKLMLHMRELGYVVEDCGAFEEDPEDDYPDFILPCARHVANDEGSFGVILGASGEGEAMAANRISGIRAAVYYGPAQHVQTDAAGNRLDVVESARKHNDANILSLGARFMSDEEAKDAVARFLATPFEGDERHMRRIRKF